jgi:hypothetical protein
MGVQGENVTYNIGEAFLEILLEIPQVFEIIGKRYYRRVIRPKLSSVYNGLRITFSVRDFDLSVIFRLHGAEMHIQSMYSNRNGNMGNFKMQIETNLRATKVVNFKTWINGGYQLQSGYGIQNAATGELAADCNGSVMLFKLQRTAKAVAAGGLIAPVLYTSSAP